MNISFSTGVFPTILKVAKVIPICKKDSKLDLSNYRPSSLLSNIEKIDNLIYNRVYNFFTKNNLIYPLQFGFGQQYSSFHALISLTEDIRKDLDKRNIRCDIFVDLQKAFGTVKHILLAKLEHSGNIMAYMVLLMNDLNPTSLTENNLFLLMVISLTKLL